MRDSAPFLVRLGLEPGADARAIRHAYARELKLIDQEQDPAGFQDLREAYDAALHWAERRPARSAPQAAPQAASQPAAQPATAAAPAAPASVAPNYSAPRTQVSFNIPAHAAPAEDNPQQLASAVFARFQQACKPLSQQHVQKTLQWQQLLLACLDDNRLLNLSARAAFEERIAQLLVSGWRPGHEALLPAACNVFNWDEDRRRLLAFGRAGAHINQAINERNMFDTLPESELMIYRATIALLRQDTEPSAYQLRGDMPYVERLMRHFPAWMALVVNLRTVAQWRALHAALPAQKKSLFGWLKRLNPFNFTWPRALVFFMVITVVRVLFSHDDAPAHSGSPPPFSQPAPATTAHLPPLMQQQIQASIPAFPHAQGFGVHQVDFHVILDDSGKVYTILQYNSSGHVAFDDAANKALRKFAPYPAQTPREFDISFTVPTVRHQ